MPGSGSIGYSWPSCLSRMEGHLVGRGRQGGGRKREEREGGGREGGGGRGRKGGGGEGGREREGGRETGGMRVYKNGQIVTVYSVCYLRVVLS